MDDLNCLFLPSLNVNYCSNYWQSFRQLRLSDSELGPDSFHEWIGPDEQVTEISSPPCTIVGEEQTNLSIISFLIYITNFQERPYCSSLGTVQHVG